MVMLTCAAALRPAAAQPSDVAGSEHPRGAIGIGTWNTAAEFKDIVVTSNGVVLYRSTPGKQGIGASFLMEGDWSFTNGVFRQSAIQPQCRLFLGNTNWADYTISLRARKIGGQEGFFVYFSCLDGGDYTWLNVAGWTNTLASVDRTTSASRWSLCDRVPQAINSNVWYNVRVEFHGDRIECYLDSKRILTASYSVPPPPVAATTPPSPAPTDAETAKNNAELRAVLGDPVCRGAIGVGAYDTMVEFRNILVTSNGEVLYKSDFEKEGMDGWQTSGGSWSVTNGVLRESEREIDCRAIFGGTNWANYTLTLQARKTAGDDGFLFYFGRRDDENFNQFTVGGSGNRYATIGECLMGRYITVTGGRPLRVETGKWYDIRVVLHGNKFECYVNSELVHSAVAQMVVSTTARYLGASRTPDGHNLRFRSGNHVFEGSLMRDRGGPPAIEIGSLVRVTGNLEPAGGPANPGNDDLDLEIFNPDDIALISPPSWWSWQRILWLSGGLLTVVTIGAIWLTTILRKNRSLTAAERNLQAAVDELEHRVEERTMDLAKANAELQHEQALFRTLLDTSYDYIYFKDLTSKFVRCSVSMRNWPGLTNGQIVGGTNFDVFSPEQARVALNEELEIIRTGRPLVGKIEKAVNPDGRVTWMMTTKMPWREADGQIIGTFGISRDITSIKEAEAELKRAQEQLIEASRAAGMAEVATGVLHNVGNVLNSVNVSTSLLTERMRASKVKLVGRTADIMKDHSADLGEFVTKDPQGLRIPQFLSDLAQHMAREEAQALEELATLQVNVDHIKEIVSMQQNYASVAGIVTNVNVTDLIEDVLRLTEFGFQRHGIKLTKEFDAGLPEISLDRHKVLQILVNLMRNAKQACKESQESDKQLTIRARAADNRLSISVIDNGVGIPKENLTRIFAHGFTTRPKGHGFGLHSSALAAKELGGELTVHSDGPGKGAIFTLELSLT